MPSSEPLRIEIEIDRSATPISGQWWRQGNTPQPFTGWTELFAALDTAVSDARPAWRTGGDERCDRPGA